MPSTSVDWYCEIIIGAFAIAMDDADLPRFDLGDELGVVQPDLWFVQGVDVDPHDRVFCVAEVETEVGSVDHGVGRGFAEGEWEILVLEVP
jgi:hypothetical protein